MITVAPNRAEPFVARAAAMPPMPEVAMRLLRALDRDDLSLPELAAIVGRDPALAARVLRLANSARYAPSRRVATLGDAAALLGLRTLRDVALAACLVGSFPKVDGFDRLVFWRGTLALAAYAQTLARLLGDVDPDTAYVGGLMLRTGQILMLMVDPPMVQRIGRLSSEIDSRMSFERSLLGCNHPEITAELARHWRFPTELIDAFRAASAPLAARPFSRLGAVLRLASVISESHEHGRTACEALESTHPDLLERLGLDLASLAAVLPEHADVVAGVHELVH